MKITLSYLYYELLFNIPIAWIIVIPFTIPSSIRKFVQFFTCTVKIPVVFAMSGFLISPTTMLELFDRLTEALKKAEIVLFDDNEQFNALLLNIQLGLFGSSPS